MKINPNLRELSADEHKNVHLTYSLRLRIFAKRMGFLIILHSAPL